MLSNWRREPLVHFLIAGVLIYAVLSWSDAEIDPASRTITVDRDQQAQIALVFERTMSRAPTDAELEAQIERYIQDEVLYREAIRLGLDQDDAVVRRRMSQKMDILASSQVETERPTRDVLRAHYDANTEVFAGGLRFTLDQLWFDNKLAADRALEKIDYTNDWQRRGEKISLPVSIKEQSPKFLVDRFGLEFVQNLGGLEAGEKWQGPVKSGLGWHLVRLVSRKADTVPRLEAIANEVEEHWRNQTVADRKARTFEQMRQSYDIAIEK